MSATTSFTHVLIPPMLRENSRWPAENTDATVTAWVKWAAQLLAFVLGLMVLLLLFVYFTRLMGSTFASAAGTSGLHKLMRKELDVLNISAEAELARKENYVNFQGTSSNPLNWPDTGHLHESIRTDGSRAFSYDLPVGSEDTGYRLNVNERDASALTDAALVAGQK